MVTNKKQSSPKLYTNSVWNIFNKEMGGNLKEHQAYKRPPRQQWLASK